jgi:TolA-binding protein
MGKRRLSRLWRTTVLATTMAGCVSTGSFDQVEQRVASLELERERLEASMAEDVARLKNLHGMLQQAEETLRRSGVKLGYRMEKIETTIPQVQGTVDSMEYRLTSMVRDVTVMKRELADRLDIKSLYLPEDVPKKPDDVWAMAQDKIKAQKIREAKAVLDYFEASFPDHKLADDAMMALANLAEGDGDISGAIKTYQKTYERYPEGDMVTKALWRIGDLLHAQGNCQKAKRVFGYLVKKYEESDEGQKAVEWVEKLNSECPSPEE